jgi:sugar phosphate isomerase/epimerase
MKIALDTICLAKRPIEEALEIAVRTRYEAVELYSDGWAGRHIPSSMLLDDVRALKKRLDDVGLSCCAISTYVGGRGFNVINDAEAQKQMEDYRKYLAIAHILNCPSLRGMPGSKEKGEGARSAQLFAKFADEDHDISLLAELHFGGLIETTEDAVKYLDLVNRDNAGVIYDPGNMLVNDAEFGAVDVWKLGKKLVHAHIKDIGEVPPDTPRSFRYGQKAFAWVQMGKGKVKYKEIFDAMADMQYGGYLSVECEGDVKGLTLEEILLHERQEVGRLLADKRH